jgi:pimeloyl-ACP methyl ester carboxylesterase
MLDQRIDVGSIQLQIREYKQDSESIIFLHFGGGNLMMWQAVVPFFQNNYHVILVDLRGHGQSDKPHKGYHIDDMAQDVIQVMQKLHLSKTHIVGSSLGAEVGLSMAANYPEIVLSLVCEGALYSEYGPYGLWEGTEAEFKEYAAQTLEKKRNTPIKVFPTVDALVEESRQVFEKRGWWNEIFESVKRYGAIKIGAGKYVASWSKMAEEYTKHYLFCRFEEYYRRVKCPVLMMPDVYPGQNEKEKQVMQGLFKLIKKGKIVTVPEWVHPYGWMLTPESGSKAVLEFWSEVIV